MSLVRGVLLSEKFRTQHELNIMSSDEQRNTLIFELATRTREPGGRLQGLSDFDLAGAGAIFSFLREGRIRSDAELKTLTIDDIRNIAIVEINGQNGASGSLLQSMNNIDLVLLGMGENIPGSLTPGSFLRGVLLAGRFCTQRELNRMTADNQRNTLIFLLATRTREPGGRLQGLNDFDLAGAGAIFVFLREGRIRSDAELKTVTIDDIRNIAIVELNGQTNLGSKLQSLRNMDLARIALGVDPAPMFKSLPGPLQPLPVQTVFSIESFEIKTQKADNEHSDSDWLSIIVTITNLNTKSIQTFPAGIQQIGGNIKSNTVMTGPYKSADFSVNDSDLVTITYVVTNLGSSDAEEQFAQAVKITNKIVQIAAPIVGAIVATILGGDPKQGVKIGQQVAEAFDKAVSTLGDVFEFFGIHIGPPNCNGVVLQDTLVYQPHEFVQAIGKPASREYTGSQENERCGAAPVTKVNFLVLQHPL